ncbi:hypothetical protein AKJ08_2764 [Vulgatibacter incomptus]|uniref:Uncharacterized protein n=1 Tax=Vulgatibacter incomptus TaxID=1391653 RepID=A0A0K1PFU4_9BACT|nr:hypothetical protein AKJ08_2764 [Vulgatibacter incomptus]
MWGFIATVVLTTLMSGSQGAGITRMNLPYMLGTLFTPNRDKAKLVGFVLHMLNGWVFAFFYALGFLMTGGATWWKGAIFGAVHAAFVLTVGMSLVPAIHPRMASEQQGPTITRRLEPPGFLGLHYGYQTPVTVLIAHVVFGIILGAFLP